MTGLLSVEGGVAGAPKLDAAAGQLIHLTDATPGTPPVSRSWAILSGPSTLGSFPVITPSGVASVNASFTTAVGADGSYLVQCLRTEVGGATTICQAVVGVPDVDGHVLPPAGADNSLYAVPTVNAALAQTYGFAGGAAAGTNIGLDAYLRFVKKAAKTKVVTAKAAATSNITKIGTQPIDGASCGVGDVVFLAGQTAESENGPWVVATGAWTRTGDVITPGLTVFVQQGTTLKGKTFVLVSEAPITVDTTPLTFLLQSSSLDARIRAKADGSTDDVANLQACFDASDSVVYSKGAAAYLIGSNATLGDAGKVHRPVPGAMVKPASGQTVTLKGWIDCPDSQQFFDLSAGGHVRFDQVINARIPAGWFGVKEGVDNSIAVQEWLDACTSGGCAVAELGNGDFNFDGVSLSGAIGLHIRGAGRDRTLLHCNNQAGPNDFLTLTNCYDITISDCAVDVGSASSVKTAGAYFKISGGFRFTFRGITAHRGFKTWETDNVASTILIDDCKWNPFPFGTSAESVDTTIDSIAHLHNCTDVKISNCEWILASRVTATRGGLVFDSGCDTMQVINSVICQVASNLTTGTNGADCVRTMHSQGVFTVTADAATDTFTTPSAHGFSAGDEVKFHNDVAANYPGGVDGLNSFFVSATGLTSTTFKLTGVDVTSTGSGTTNVWNAAKSFPPRWIDLISVHVEANAFNGFRFDSGNNINVVTPYAISCINGISVGPEVTGLNVWGGIIAQTRGHGIAVTGGKHLSFHGVAVTGAGFTTGPSSSFSCVSFVDADPAGVGIADALVEDCILGDDTTLGNIGYTSAYGVAVSSPTSVGQVTLRNNRFGPKVAAHYFPTLEGSSLDSTQLTVATLAAVTSDGAGNLFLGRAATAAGDATHLFMRGATSARLGVGATDYVTVTAGAIALGAPVSGSGYTIDASGNFVAASLAQALRSNDAATTDQLLTSTTYATLQTVTLTFPGGGCVAKVDFSACVSTLVAGATLRLVLDGVEVAGTEMSVGAAVSAVSLALSRLVSVSAGSHTIAVQYKVGSGGTLRVRAGTTDSGEHASLVVVGS